MVTPRVLIAVGAVAVLAAGAGAAVGMRRGAVPSSGARVRVAAARPASVTSTTDPLVPLLESAAASAAGAAAVCEAPDVAETGGAQR